jgi:hypothetical protein
VLWLKIMLMLWSFFAKLQLNPNPKGESSVAANKTFQGQLAPTILASPQYHEQPNIQISKTISLKLWNLDHILITTSPAPAINPQQRNKQKGQSFSLDPFFPSTMDMP